MSLAETLAEIWAELSSIKKRLPSVSPATVTSIDPVRIQVDGQTAPVAASPDSLVPVGPGDRVRVLRYGTSHLVIGRVNTRGVPYRMAGGRVVLPNTGADTASTSVDFPAGRFTVAPLIDVSVEQSSGLVNATFQVSSTALTIHIRRVDGQPIGAEYPVHWTATQMSPTSAGG